MNIIKLIKSLYYLLYKKKLKIKDLTRLYTKNGDEGNTFLLFGQKVSKSDIQFIDYLSKVLSLYLSTQSPETIGKYGLIDVSKPA